MAVKRLLSFAGIVPATVLAFASLASATPLGLDFADIAGTAGYYGAGNYTVGWVFNVNAPVRVDGLALFDWGADGLKNASPHTVGLWHSSGTLVASTDVTNSSTPTTSTSSFGNWLVQSIGPVVLGPGTYAIGGLFYGGDSLDAFVARGAASTIPQISFVGNALSPSFGMPSSFVPDLDDGFFGVSLTAEPVPEPSTLLLLGAGLLVVGRRLRPHHP
jgi:hypothetical protein